MIALDGSDQLQADTQLFEEVLGYLLRLPAVPTTVAMARKIKERVEDPARKAMERRAVEAARVSALRHGVNYVPSGLPVIEAEVDADILRLWTPSGAALGHIKDEWPQILVRRLQKIETITLRPGPSTHFE